MKNYEWHIKYRANKDEPIEEATLLATTEAELMGEAMDEFGSPLPTHFVMVEVKRGKASH